MRRLFLWATCAFSLLGVSSANAQVVISQIYGGGGNSGATLRSDFVELFNRGEAAVDVTGWSVQYASSSGSSWQVTVLGGTIEPGGYYLVKQNDGSGGSVALPSPDATGTISMSASSGKVALVSSAGQLTGVCPTGVVDFVGFGSANCFEGSDGTPNPSNTNAVHRLSNGCTDTNDNAADFEPGAPNPRNSATPRRTCAVDGETNPTASGMAEPSSVVDGELTTLTVTVVPGSNPTSSGIQVLGDLSSIGGSSNQPFVTADGVRFTFDAIVADGTPAGDRVLPVSVTDAQGRATSASIELRVESRAVEAAHVVISQVYGGGGNSGAIYNRDFVELYNPTSGVVDVTGWTLQYASSSGSVTGNNNTVQPLGGLIGPGEYLLVALASGSNGVDLPDANLLGAMNLSASSGKIALVMNGELLDGTCPLGDADLVDYVGYGSANCSEGGSAAPSANNTTALFRLGGGSVDSDFNAADFERGMPAPRRTAAIMEIGPSIVSTDPGTDGFNVPRDGSISVFFTEPVVVTGTWFSIQCETTGVHDEYTVAGGGKSYVITPNVNFLAGETCMVSVHAAQVSDQDTDDAQPGTDTLAVDHVWTFSIATGAPPPFASDVHLLMGNPSNAVTDEDHANNYLMEKPEFALSYSRDRGTPNWVSWHLSSEWVGSLRRFDTFRPDPQVLPSWYRVQAFDFSGSGFDRGHVVPNADRDNEASRPVNQATFLMTNMIPQAPDNNQGPWANFENYLRTLLDGNELYIVAGGAGTGGAGSNGYAAYIADGNVAVPAHTWKAALVLPKFDGDDLERVNGSARTIAVIMPNIQGIRTSNPEDWRAYLTTVDAVESLSGYDLFSRVAASVQNAIEAGIDGDNPPGAADQAIGVMEDSNEIFTLDAVSGNAGSLDALIGSGPASGSLHLDGTVATYTPSPDYFGEDRFTYTVSDGVKVSGQATVTLVVMEVNDAPVAGGDSATTDDDTTLTLPFANLLANDIPGPVNESAQTMSLASVQGTSDTHGTVSVVGDSVVYVPDAGFAGSAAFEYSVCDDGMTAGRADSRCGAGTVLVTVLDTTAPAISELALSQTSLWPVNHKMVDVSVGWNVFDSGDAAPVCTIGVLSSDAANTTGDGNTVADHEIVNEHLVRLRAERSATGEGRVYTIAINCSDASGNAAERTAAVVVGR